MKLKLYIPILIVCLTQAVSCGQRGSTVDLTLFDMKTGREVDMGAPFDWFGQESFPDTYFDFPVSFAIH